MAKRVYERKMRDVRIPADAAPMVTQAEVARWFGVPNRLINYWQNRGWLGEVVRQGPRTVLFHTDAVRRFGSQFMGVEIDGEEQEKGARGNAPGVIL